MDDEEVLRGYVRKALEKIGNVTVIEEGDAKKALEDIPELKPDLLVLDVFNPQMNGNDLLEALVRNKTRIPAIVISGSPEKAQTKEAVYWAQQMYKPAQLEAFGIEPYDSVGHVPDLLKGNIKPYFLKKPMSNGDLIEHAKMALGNQ